MFSELEEISSHPRPFEFYTASELWTDEHTSAKMLEYHLDGSVDLSSRNMDFITRSASWISLRFGLGEGSSVCDFGCGPGLYTTLFAAAGARVTGIDFSPRSIAYARKTALEKHLDITYVNENYLEWECDQRFDLITMIFCDFCALSPDQRSQLLGKFYRCLKPGGHVLLDVHSVNVFNSRSEDVVFEKNQMDHFWSADDYYVFLNIFKYEKELVTLDKYTIIEQSRTRTVYNWLQYFTRESIAEELAAGGFSVLEFYANVAGSSFYNESPDIAVVARRN